MVKDLVVKCRGLPYSCTEDQLRKFFGDTGISKVNLIMRDGRAAGDAFVHFSNEDDYKHALKKDREHLGHRYIEVMPADEESSRASARERDRGRDRDRDRRDRSWGPYSRGMSRGGPVGYSGNGEGVVRLRGLPYGARERDIYDFFAPLQIVPDGILLPDERIASKTNGEAYVVFADQETADRALMRHMKNMQHRYIEVFTASYGEMVQFCDDHRLRVPRGNGGGFGGMARGGYDDGYGGFGYLGRSGDRGAAVGPWEESRGAPFGGAPLPDPYSGSYSSSWGAARPVSPPRVASSYSDTFGRASLADPYGRAVPASDPYGRPPADDPYMRGSRRSDDLYGRRSDPFDSYPRSGSETWRDDRPAPAAVPPAGYSDSWQDYGYSSSGGGPMRVRDQWREDSRGPAAAAPRGRERPGQKYTLKMRGVPFRAIEADIYDFFEPIRPTNVEIIHEASGRPSGEARVEFSSRKDYDEALLKDKQYMGPRYVELFPDFGRY
ncbi:hypothetical protein V3C99_003857 [Haemonchus contortus]|uniref:RRM domain-containing protein n=1 Tax=Haemonchus contortus TaxID=6289 RepID=A0A7I4XYX6_HAECO|nr:RNA recognition motif domain containing protein [Haemonchus contortus]